MSAVPFLLNSAVAVDSGSPAYSAVAVSVPAGKLDAG
jgi:hypothetical protein